MTSSRFCTGLAIETQLSEVLVPAGAMRATDTHPS